MSELRNKIQTTTTPAVHNRRDYSTVAKITAANEINNLCSIEFIDKDGYKSNKDNVPVKILYPGFIGWFPSLGENVTVEISESYMIITGKCEDGYASTIRAKTTTKQDIYTSSFGGTMAGSIF
jgi:hypothetical protein